MAGDWDKAAVGDVTKPVFKLNGGVIDVELGRKHVLDPAQDHVAF